MKFEYEFTKMLTYRSLTQCRIECGLDIAPHLHLIYRHRWRTPFLADEPFLKPHPDLFLIGFLNE